MTLTQHVTRAFYIDVSSSRVVCVISMQGIKTGLFLSLSCKHSCHFWFCVHYITYKVIGFFRNKNIKLVAAAIELLLFLRLLHTSIFVVVVIPTF